jgi:hypothetical protein
MTIALRPTENPTEQVRLMEDILERENMPRALKRVRANKGAPGIDGKVLQGIWDPTFSANSFGFRPGRSQHDALKQAKKYVEDDCRHIVDMDLEKFWNAPGRSAFASIVQYRIGRA